MTVNNAGPGLSLDQAIKFGQDVFEVEFDNWGLRLTSDSTDFTNLRYPGLDDLGTNLPGLNASLAGLVIGPRSTVDRAWVAFNLQVKRGAGNTPPTDRMRRLSVDSPLFMTLASATTPQSQNLINDSPFSAMSRLGVLYVWAMNKAPSVGSVIGFTEPSTVMGYRTQIETTVLPPSYTKIDGVTAASFGLNCPLIPVPGAAPTSPFVAPILHLVAYLKKPIVAPPSARFPAQFQSAWAIVTPAGTPGEQCIGQIPIFGRHGVQITIGIVGAGLNTIIRIATLRAINEGINIESPEATTTIGAGVGKATAHFNLSGPQADYLLIYATPSGAENTVTTINVVVTAYDHHAGQATVVLG